jgi:hypothetical protein
MDWYNPISWLTDTETNAANVARQWQTIINNAAAMTPEDFRRVYDAMVAAYGTPPAEVLAALDQARQSVATGVDYNPPDVYAALTGQLETTLGQQETAAIMAALPADIAAELEQLAENAGAAVSGAVGGFLTGVPAWVKIAALGALGVWLYRTFKK